MSQQEETNPFLDKYNYNIEFEKKWTEKRAAEFIEEQYDLLIKAGFSPTAAGNRLKTDLLEIWSERTIRNYLPKSAKNPRMARPKGAYYEAANFDETIIATVTPEGEDETDFDKQMAQAEANTTETLPPVTRRCPSCNVVIAIRDNYQLSVYQ